MSINPYDFPVRVRCARYRDKAFFWHIVTLAINMITVVSAGWVVSVTDRKVILLLAVAVILSSFALSYSANLTIRALHQQEPRRATVWLAYKRIPVRVRLRQDMDLPEGTYVAWRRGKPWIPPTLITRISINDISPGQTIVFGNVVINYEQAVARFMHQLENLN